MQPSYYAFNRDNNRTFITVPANYIIPAPGHNVDTKEFDILIKTSVYALVISETCYPIYYPKMRLKGW